MERSGKRTIVAPESMWDPCPVDAKTEVNTVVGVQSALKVPALQLDVGVAGSDVDFLFAYRANTGRIGAGLYVAYCEKTGGMDGVLEVSTGDEDAPDLPTCQRQRVMSRE